MLGLLKSDIEILWNEVCFVTIFLGLDGEISLGLKQLETIDLHVVFSTVIIIKLTILQLVIIFGFWDQQENDDILVVVEGIYRKGISVLPKSRRRIGKELGRKRRRDVGNRVMG